MRFIGGIHIVEITVTDEKKREQKSEQQIYIYGDGPHIQPWQKDNTFIFPDKLQYQV